MHCYAAAVEWGYRRHQALEVNQLGSSCIVCTTLAAAGAAAVALDGTGFS